MPKYETLEKLCHMDDGENRWKTTVEMAIDLINAIIKAYPEKFYYIGQTSINSHDFFRKCPRDQDMEEFAIENLLQDDHGPLTNRKINSKVDARKVQYGLMQFITIFRAETEKDLRDAEREILEAFINKKRCLNEKRKPGDGLAAIPFHHGYVYFAYDGLPLHPHWLRSLLSSMELSRRERAKSIDNVSTGRQYLYGNTSSLYEVQRSFKNLQLRDVATSVQSGRLLYPTIPTIGYNQRDKATQTEHVGILYRLPDRQSPLSSYS